MTPGATWYTIGLSIFCIASWLSPVADAAGDSFSGDSCICPGDTITYRCTVLDNGIGVTSWSGTAVDAAIIEYSCPPTVFDLTHIRFDDPGGISIMCGGGALVARSVEVVMSSPDNCYTSEFTVRAFPELDGTVIECSLSSGFREVGSSSLIVAAQQSTPDSVSVTFSDDIPQFSLRWNSGPSISCDPTEQYAVDISGPDDFCNPSGGLEFVDASTMEYQCSNWPQSSLGQTYTFRVAAVNCGSNQTGLFSSPVSVQLQVPAAPTLTACPAYAQSTGELLRIESKSTTVPVMPIANGVDGSPDAYIFSYNGGSQSVVSSGQCIGGTCTDVFTPTDPTVSQYTVSVTAMNVVGEGPPDTSIINAINNLLEVEVDVVRRILQCRFLGGFAGTAQCQIEYSTREDLSGSVVDTGSGTSGDTVTVTITATLEGRTTYYYRVTATAEGGSVRVQGIFQTACLFSDLVQDMEVQLVTDGCDSRFVGGVITSAGTGRACYNGTATGSSAVYACNCPSLYKLEGTATRICQSDGTWTGAMPQCLPECVSLPAPPLSGGNEPTVICSNTSSLTSADYGCSTTQFNTVTCQWPEAPTCPGLSLGAAVGITFALTFLVAFTVGLIVAFVIAYCYVQRQILKGQYSPSDSQQPTPIQASSHVQEGGIELKENISYGPVPSQPPAPQQRGPMYEEIVQTGNIEVKANVAYGPVSH